MSKTVPQMWEFQNHGDLFMYFAAWVLAVALGIFNLHCGIQDLFSVSAYGV